MTTDHDPIEPDDHEFDDRVAQRLRRATADMQLPTATAAQAEADGRRLRRRTRVLASIGAVTVIAAAIGAAFAIQPLGTADVVQLPPIATAGSCPSAVPVEESSQPPGLETRLESAGISGWALLSAEAPPWPAGEPIKIVWRLDGSGEPEPVAMSPSGTQLEPGFFQPHTGSNWDRPGDEYETVYVFDEPGCWHLQMTRDEGSASLAVQIVDRDDLDPAELTADQFDARLTQARAAADDVDDDNVVHEALIDGVVTLEELDTARQRAEQCARESDPSAQITLGEHLGDVGITYSGNGNAVERCEDRHLVPTLQAFITLFEPTLQQQASVPDCTGDDRTACLDDAESVVDDIMLANLRRARDLGHGPDS